MLPASISRRFRRLSALVSAALSDPRRRGVPLVRVEPCYWVVDRLSRESTIVDIGLGFDADFSAAMVQRYGLTSFGFDPTRKHQPGLAEVARRCADRFHLRELAIGPRGGTATFHESAENVSGSLLAEHPNVARDTVVSYPVRIITLAEALAMAGGNVDLVKMDVEGAEYETLDNTPDAVLAGVAQWAIEFHWDVLPAMGFARTRAIVRRFESLAFTAWTRDNVNFLFFREKAQRGSAS